MAPNLFAAKLSVKITNIFIEITHFPDNAKRERKARYNAGSISRCSVSAHSRYNSTSQVDGLIVRAPSFEEPAEALVEEQRPVRFAEEEISEDPSIGGPPQEIRHSPPLPQTVNIEAPPQQIPTPPQAQPEPQDATPHSAPASHGHIPGQPYHDQRQAPPMPVQQPVQGVPPGPPVSVSPLVPALPPHPMTMGYGVPQGMPGQPFMPPSSPRFASPWGPAPSLDPFDIPSGAFGGPPMSPPWLGEVQQARMRQPHLRRRPAGRGSRMRQPRVQVQYAEPQCVLSRQRGIWPGALTISDQLRSKSSTSSPQHPRFKFSTSLLLLHRPTTMAAETGLGI